jgi:hypothetical protein
LESEPRFHFQVIFLVNTANVRIGIELANAGVILQNQIEAKS